MTTIEEYTEKLILAVQNRPALYDRDQKDWANKAKTEKMWNEICESIVTNWIEMSNAKKEEKVQDLKTRWRNIRTCFRRELNKQRQDKSGKRRKYIYSEQLSFLLPYINLPDDMGSFVLEQEASDYDDNLTFTEVAELYDTPSASSTTMEEPKEKKMASPPSFHETLLNVLKVKVDDEKDADRLFLLSLVSYFKNIADDKKLEVKMEFLRIIKEASS